MSDRPVPGGKYAAPAVSQRGYWAFAREVPSRFNAGTKFLAVSVLASGVTAGLGWALGPALNLPLAQALLVGGLATALIGLVLLLSSLKVVETTVSSLSKSGPFLDHVSVRIP